MCSLALELPSTLQKALEKLGRKGPFLGSLARQYLRDSVGRAMTFESNWNCFIPELKAADFATHSHLVFNFRSSLMKVP